ncbi:MAG: HTH domain-containing protein [Candidatus Paceibacterota bacterium]|jgi:transposase-like protein
MRTTFSNEELLELRKHPCVFSCTSKLVNYTYEFKKRALEEYEKGIGPKDIWKQAGFDTSKWKNHYFRLTIKDWKRIVRRGDLSSLNNQGGVQYDDGMTKSLKAEKDKIKRLELQIRYLQAENDFLAKLRAKRAERNSGRVKNTKSSEN